MKKPLGNKNIDDNDWYIKYLQNLTNPLWLLGIALVSQTFAQDCEHLFNLQHSKLHAHSK